MRRDIGGEVIAAIAAVALLAFAITFGILLSVSDANSDENATASAVLETDSNIDPIEELNPEASETSVPQPTPVSITEQVLTQESATPEQVAAAITDTPTASELPASETATRRPTNVEPDETEVVFQVTETASSTFTQSPTATVKPSETPHPTETDVPTLTQTPSRTSTNTATVTPLPSRTRRPTATASNTVTQTATHTQTLTATATVTSTRTASRTPTHTMTATFTPTRTASPTFTPRPSETSGILPTPTGTITPEQTATLMACTAPEHWSIYVVQTGNTLFSIARAVESSVNELRLVNCLEDVNNIFIGQELYVPVLPSAPVATGIPAQGNAAIERQGVSSIGCTSPLVQITNPAAGQRIREAFLVAGTATLGNFGYYKLEIRADSGESYNFLSRSETPVIDGELGRVDRSLFQPGLHWLRLVVVDNTGNIPLNTTCVIPILFE